MNLHGRRPLFLCSKGQADIAHKRSLHAVAVHAIAMLFDGGLQMLDFFDAFRNLPEIKFGTTRAINIRIFLDELFQHLTAFR